MTPLRTALGGAVGTAFAEAGLAASYGRVTPSDRPDLADFQCNGALAAAKAAGRNPREIAAAVAEILKADPRFSAVEVAGPGFINLRNSDAVLAKEYFDLPVTFPAGQDRVQQTQDVFGITIPRADMKVSGANFEVLIGFDVTPQMVDFNRQGKRFRANAGATASAQ